MKTSLRSLIVLGLLLVMAGVSAVTAQDASSRVLTSGTAINGTLDSENPIQVYTYVGTAEQSVSFTVSEES
jgi:hypothetical protein